MHQEKIKLRTKSLKIGLIFPLAPTMTYNNSTTHDKILSISQGDCNSTGEIKNYELGSAKFGCLPILHAP